MATPTTTRKANKGTTKRVTVGGTKNERVTTLQTFRAAADKARDGEREKKAAIKSMIAIAPHGTQITDPKDSTTWQVVNEPYQSDPKQSAWDALMAGNILTPAQRVKVDALYAALREDKSRHNITKV